MRYLIKFSYDGTKFHGFQRQNNVINVQGTLENVLSEVLKTDIIIKGSGRTDAGVHAIEQCAHFDFSHNIKSTDITMINALLNKNIIVKKIIKVPDNFHARHSVKAKTYRYLINVGKYDLNKEGYYCQIKYDLNLSQIKKAAKLFLGTHDFRNFVSGPRIDYTTTIFKVSVKKRKSFIIIEFTGVGFYRYMVRHLVGALIDVGRGKVSLDVVLNMLDNPIIDKKLSVVPAEGLYLVKVFY